MIGSVRRLLFTVRYSYTDPLDAGRAALLLSTAWVFLIIGIAGVLFVLALANGGNIDQINLVVTVTVMLVAILMLVLIQRGRVALAGVTFVGMLLVVTSFMAITFFGSIQMMSVVLPLIIAAFIFNWRGVLVTLLILLTAGIYGGLLAGNDETAPGMLMGYALTIMAATLLLAAFASRLQRLTQESTLELSRVSRLAGVLTATGSSETTDSLIQRVLDVLAGDLNLTFARVYMLDAEATGIRAIYARAGVEHPSEGNARLHPESALQEAARTRHSVRIDQRDAPVRRNHLVPGMVAGLVVPLLQEQTVLGLVDLQSAAPLAFTGTDRETIRLLVLQLAASLASLRQIETLRQEVHEQQEIVLRQRDRLRQIERADRQAVTGAWADYLQQRSAGVIGYDLQATAAFTPAADLPAAMQQTLAAGETRLIPRDEGTEIAVPILLRGQPLGVMSFTLPPNRPPTRRQVELITGVVQRLALALDNKRLFEQSQSQARRERKASEIAGLLIASTSVETVMELAAASFNDALGAIQTRIYLTSQEALPAQPEGTP
jgi:GAF domain-containing protein